MQYRLLTKDKIKVSKLGFGCMRFPVISGDNSMINTSKAHEMLNELYKRGVNYFDTAYVYHSENSEELLGDFLRKIDRTTVYVATKMPMWLAHEHDDYQKFFDIQLKRLQTDYIDFYLTHSLSEKSFKKMKELDVFKFLDEMKAQGKIKYAGFSFHDELPVFKQIVDSYDWDFCQIQLNYLDIDYQAGLEGLNYASERGLDVIVMEPIKGGQLADVPTEVKAILDRSDRKMSAAEWAQRWVYSQSGVSLLLSGMSRMDQVVQNIDIAETADDTLIEKDMALLDEVRDYFKSRVKIGCTSCEYCMPCPSGVNIPGVFDLYNKASMFDYWERNKESYSDLIKEGKDASVCTECSSCESICPQHLEIIDGLVKADVALR